MPTVSEPEQRGVQRPPERDVVLCAPAELAALLETDVPQWQRVVAATGIKVE